MIKHYDRFKPVTWKGSLQIIKELRESIKEKERMIKELEAELNKNEICQECVDKLDSKENYCHLKDNRVCYLEAQKSVCKKSK